MDADQDNDGPPAAVEGGGPVSIELKMYRASREGWPDLLQQLINDQRAGITPEACTVFEDEEHDEDYYDEFEIDRLPGWTCLHIAAFNGNTERSLFTPKHVPKSSATHKASPNKSLKVLQKFKIIEGPSKESNTFGINLALS